MERFQLFINDRQVEFDTSESPILFQRQRTDYTNPTIVKNSFTKTVTIPGTKTNTQIFNDIWKLDRIQTNQIFNPSKRTSFTLIKNGDLVEKGYLKLNRINYKNNFFTYEITLYGELGNILYNLSYLTDPQTDETTPMTLGDLDYDLKDGQGNPITSLTIQKDEVSWAWDKLEDPDMEGYDRYLTFNFAVCYDGIPKANNFDAKKTWVATGMNGMTQEEDYTGNRPCAVFWEGNKTQPAYNFGMFPNKITVDGTTYESIYTGDARTPGDRFGLFELNSNVTPLETRDLRCYLLRPVIKLSKIFDAIGRYMETNMGYTLDLSDPFFSTKDYTDTWMTLSMLYDIDPNVESGQTFTFKQLLSATGTPASYLVSYCKTYGIYLDVDYKNKTFVLTRLPNFFTGTDKEMMIDKSRDIKITPLSFDKATYIFNYGTGSESELLKKYKATYGTDYGEKRVNTGYRFDTESAPYIEENIFNTAVDTIEQSIYYRYPYAFRGTDFFAYPQALTDLAHLPTYKLFEFASGEYNTQEGVMQPVMKYDFGGTDKGFLWNSGYQFIDEGWAGLRQNIWQDAYPRIQLHSDQNKGVEGKDILITFSGFQQVKYGSAKIISDTKTLFTPESGNAFNRDFSYVHYLLSDDIPALKGVIGKNTYYDNPCPVNSVYMRVVDKLPVFTRNTFNLSNLGDYIPVCIYKGFGGDSIFYTTPNCDVSTTAEEEDNYYLTTVSSAATREYSAYNGVTYKNNHTYFVGAIVSTTDYQALIEDGLAYPDIIGSELIDYKGLDYSSGTPGDLQAVASIVHIGDTGTYNHFASLSIAHTSTAVSWRTYELIVYDLTEYSLDQEITTAQKGIDYFGLRPDRYGFNFHLDDILDFSLAREIYIPFCTYTPGTGIYNRYWKNYISDIYSVNTRVMECYCYLDNINDVFKEFYYYDNSWWILSKITDWNGETKLAKATFIKVNDKNNYIL